MRLSKKSKGLSNKIVLTKLNAINTVNEKAEK
mgnify:CR=1 FL=1